MNYLSLPGIDEIVSSLAMTLVHFTWQAVVIALVLKFILLFSKKQALKLRYYSTVIALSVCVLWPGYTFNSFYHQTHAAKTPMSQVEFATEEGYLTFRIPIAPGKPVRIVEPLPVTPESETIGIDYQLLVLIWVLGVAMMLVKLIFDLRQTYRLTRVGVSDVDDEIHRIVGQISKRFDIKRNVTVLKSSLVNVPVVIGWFKPTVLLPIAICIGLERHQLELILAHELAHVKRLDFLVNLTQGLIQVLFFYHPCIYWINKVLREEREYICDSMALGAYENTPTARLELAKALLNIEELKEGNLPLVAVAASDGHLKKRIGRIVLNERLRMPSARGLLVVLFGMIFSVTTIAVTADMSTQVKRNKSLSAETNNTLISNRLSLLDRENLASRPFSEDLSVNKRNVVESTLDLGSISSTGLEVDLHKIGFTAHSNMNEPTGSLKRSDDDVLNPVSDIRQELDAQNVKVTQKSQSTEKLDSSVQSTAINLAPTIKVTEEKILQDIELAPINTQIPDNNENEKLSAKQDDYRVLRLALLDAKNTSQFIAPKALETPYPIYPKGAFYNSLEGRIKVDFVIDERGFVVNPQFSEGTPWVFYKEIKSKLRRWRYKPAEKSGEIVAYNSSVFFDFKLPDEKPLERHRVGTRIKHRTN